MRKIIAWVVVCLMIAVGLVACGGGGGGGTTPAATVLTAPTGTITVDGNTSDWAGISPMITDATGDCSSVNGCDISKVYVAKDSSKVYIRLVS